MTNRRRVGAGAVLASISAMALVANAAPASAQGYDQQPPPGGYNQGPPPGVYDQGPQGGYDQGPQGGYDQGPQNGYGQNQPQQRYDDYRPPQGQYAPPPPGAYNGGAYDDMTQRYDRDYSSRYSSWAAQNCLDRRNNNTAAGAIIGGILGSVVGSSVAGRHQHFGGAVIGGALGATAGAAIGSSSTDTTGCPPGYYVRAGAPAFYYSGPYSAPPGGFAPSWYNPWAFESGRYIYRPYRYWYWQHPNYWRPGFRAGHWHNRYQRW